MNGFYFYQISLQFVPLCECQSRGHKMQITRKQHQYQHQPGKTILVCLRDDENGQQHPNESGRETEREPEERQLTRGEAAQLQSTGLKALSCRLCKSHSLYVCVCERVCLCVCVCKKFNEDICYSQCTLKLFCGKQRSHWWRKSRAVRRHLQVLGSRGKQVGVGSGAQCVCCCRVRSARQ